MSIKRLIRERFFPHIWCAGCGHGIILNALLHAVDELGIPQNNLCMVSGIGCSARISGYVDFHSMHTLHGRALAFATGIKMARPDLSVFVPMGDGDAMAIGGNHFIHACRRNIDMVAIIMNNRIYGMTGGQFSPLSGRGIRATTAPYGNIDTAFDTVQLALGAGATFVAWQRRRFFTLWRWSRSSRRPISTRGFLFWKCSLTGPTYFGRKNKLGGPVQMLEWFRDDTGSSRFEKNMRKIRHSSPAACSGT